MVLGKKIWFTALAAASVLAQTAPLAANVREGVDAWSRGDYSAAVEQWQGPAQAGDPDAMFNLGQAYRLGRGVPLDPSQAEVLYQRAAQAGHVQASDTYGLMLFQDGRRNEALPFVQAASRRGDPRAQYLMGIAHFNGDLVPKDWERAYALLTLANGAGLPQAASAIGQMDQHIPIEQRQQATQLARQLQTEAQSARATELASADLAMQAGEARPATPPATQVASAPTPRVPRPIQTTSVSPSVAAARDAVTQARQATGTEDPADAGASFAGGRYASAPQVAVAAPQPVPVRTPTPAPVRVATPAPVPAPAPAATSSGPWRVQLGAFSVRSNAENLWSRLSSRSEIAGRERLMVPAGRVVKLQAGGFASQGQAQTACNSLKRSGQDCIVTRR